MAKVVVTGIVRRVTDGTPQLVREHFNVDELTPGDIKSILLHESEKRIADIKMGRFGKVGQHD